jgi:hypothetical protein
MLPSVLTPGELEALSHWSMGELGQAELPRDGSVNRTVSLETIYLEGNDKARVFSRDKFADRFRIFEEDTHFISPS